MLYKILQDGGRPHIGGGEWFLPHGKRPGKWMPTVEKISMCNAGYHLVDADHIIDFLGYGYHIYEAEERGECLTDTEKSCHQGVRLLRELQWGEREARLFACDCAERALDLWAQRGTVDPRSRAAVDVARRFANGEATADEISAAESAAWSAAAWLAESAAAWSAWSAAESAAPSAASAAWSAAWSAARSAERRWQNARLLDYLYGRVAK